jgi:hypothetical protein
MSSAEATPPVWKVRMVSWRARLTDRLGRDDADGLAMSTSLPVASERP